MYYNKFIIFKRQYINIFINIISINYDIVIDFNITSNKLT